MKEMHMPGPLHGIKVLEVCQIIAGPYCGTALADLGAEVIKLEPPAGEGARRIGQFAPHESKAFHSLSRGKRGLVIDLTTQSGRAVVHRLIRDIDVFITNPRPGVTRRLQIDYDSLRQHRPDLIYLETTGFGVEGPSAERAGSDIVVQAYSGLLAGDMKVGPDGAPEHVTATAPADYVAALGGAMGVCAALYHRNLTGEGQFISTSLLAAGLTLQSSWVSRVPVSDAILVEPLRATLNEMRANGSSYAEMNATRRDLPRQGKAFRLYYGGYRVKDGAIILGALTPRNREQIRRALGITDDPTDSDDFNAISPDSDDVVAELKQRISNILMTATMDEWIARLDAEGAPASKVNWPEEIADDPQVAAINIMRDIEHPLTGPERHVGPLIEMSGTPTGTDRSSPPLDAETDDILCEHGFSETEIADLRSSGAIGVSTGV